MSRKFTCYMVQVGAGTNGKFARLNDSEFRAHVVGVLAVASSSAIRGCLFVGNQEAEAIDVAMVAGVPERVARTCLAKLKAVGVLYRDDELGCWRVHDWDDIQIEPRVDQNAGRRQALHRDVKLRQVIRERDQDRCRYCNVEVRWQDRRSPIGGTYDHLDPDGPNADWNLVVACRGCNSRKRDKLAADVGMELLPEPTPTYPGPTPDPHGTYSEPTPEVEGEETTPLSPRPGGDDGHGLSLVDPPPPGPPPSGNRKTEKAKWESAAVAFAHSVLPHFEPRQAYGHLGTVWMRMGGGEAYGAGRDEVRAFVGRHKPELLLVEGGGESAA